MLVALEQNPPKPYLSREQIAYNTIQCFVHAPGITKSFRRDIIRSSKSDKALKRVEKEILVSHPEMKYIMGTTQAVDLINGGVKVNALPEQATAVVNHRIDTARRVLYYLAISLLICHASSSVEAVKGRVSSVLRPVVQGYNLSFTSFGELLSTSSSGSVVISDAFGNSLEPAPRTPTDRSAPWSLLSASIRAAIEDSGVEIDKNKV